MNHSIVSNKNKNRFCVGKNIKNTYIEWYIEERIEDFFKKYKEEYQVKNDIVIFEISYFDFLCKIFEENSFSLKDIYIDMENIYDNYKEEIYEKRIDIFKGYTEKGIKNDTNNLLSFCLEEEIDIIKEIDDILNIVNDSSNKKLMINNEEKKEENNNIEKAIENVNSYKEEFLEKNKIILIEFKDFLLGFENYIIKSIPEKYNEFKEYLNILKEDINFFKNTKIKSLSKYKFAIGSELIKRNYQNIKFIPAGLCYYGDKIFLNSNNVTQGKKHGSLWFKRKLKNILYHEVGHSLDFLYYNEIVLKTQKDITMRSSYNEDYKNICIKNYNKFKYFKYHLPKYERKRLSYYLIPSIKEKNINIKLSNSLIEYVKHVS